GRDQVDLAVEERGEQGLARHGHKNDVYPVGRLAAPIQLVFEELQRLVRDTALHAPVDEVVRAAEDDPCPDDASRHHAVKVAGPLLEENGGHGFRQQRLSWNGRVRADAWRSGTLAGRGLTARGECAG